MIRLHFTCKFETDIILHSTAATEGHNSSLDYIPGSAFLGMVAKKYKDFGDNAFDVFHSGKVRFSDGHLLGANSMNRSLKVPASYLLEKGEKLAEGAILKNSLLMNDEEKKEDIDKAIQRKQERVGFVIFQNDQEKLHKLSLKKTIKLKSAWDREKRKTAHSQMFAYESLPASSTWGFTIEIDDCLAELKDQVIHNICGRQQLGKSKTAEYGLVKIELVKEENPSFESKQQVFDELYFYVESPLALLNGLGYPTLVPSPTDFGIEGKFCSEKSQILSRSYAPYNGKRKTRDADRNCIDKGSVLVFNDVTSIDYEKISKGIGLYLSEGFGKVLIHPEFLTWKEVSSFKPEKVSETNTNGLTDIAASSSNPLIQYLLNKEKEARLKDVILRNVDDFINKNQVIYRKTTPSQWGGIRERAHRAKNREDLMLLLFGTSGKSEQPTNQGYLTHGVASEVWSEARRIDKLKDWIDGLPASACDAVAVLASAMAKELSKKKENHG